MILKAKLETPTEVKLGNNEQLAERLAELMRMYGTETANNAYRIDVRNLKIIIDGRLAEEYEDLPNFAPCQIDYLVVESNSRTPWFNMFTAFATNFPLMSADRYAASVLSSDILQTIIDRITEQCSSSKLSKKRIAEMNRAKWLQATEKYAGTLYLKNVYPEDHYTAKGEDFHSAVDQHYCCYDKNFRADYIISLSDIKKNIIESIDKTAALFLRIEYPTYKALHSSSYLANQTGERWARWESIIPLVHKKINKELKPEEFKSYIAKDPADVLVGGKLPGTKPKKINKTLRVPAPDHVAFPKFSNLKNYESATLEQKTKSNAAFEKSALKKINEMGHPRFEIKFEEPIRKLVEAQIRQLAFYHYRKSLSNNNRIQVFNWEADLSLPLIGHEVIDHLDKDTTPYLLNDIVVLARKDRVIDNSPFYTTVRTDKGDAHVVFKSIMESDHNLRHFSDKGMIALIEQQKTVIDKHSNKPIVSKRTGMEYMLRSMHARVDVKTIEKLVKQFDF